MYSVVRIALPFLISITVTPSYLNSLPSLSISSQVHSIMQTLFGHNGQAAKEMFLTTNFLLGNCSYYLCARCGCYHPQPFMVSLSNHENCRVGEVHPGRANPSHPEKGKGGVGYAPLDFF